MLRRCLSAVPERGKDESIKAKRSDKRSSSFMLDAQFKIVTGLSLLTYIAFFIFFFAGLNGEISYKLLCLKIK